MGCARWRFTYVALTVNRTALLNELVFHRVIELQAIVVELLENFEFAIPDEKPDIQRVPGGLMIPMIRGKPQLGSQMPLKVTPIERAQKMEV